jgi:hypothetical protein
VEGPGAYVGLDAFGRFVFRSRNHEAQRARSLASQAAFYDRAAGAELTYDAPIGYDDGGQFYDGTGGLRYIGAPTYDAAYRDIVTDCTVETVVRAQQALQDVWSFGATVSLAANEVRTFTAEASDPFDGATCILGTDVVVGAGSIASIALGRTSGSDVPITLTAGAAGATLTTLKLRAQPYAVQSSRPVRSTADASSAIAKYKTKTETISSRRELDPNAALDLANTYVRRYSRPRPQLELTVLNRDAAHLHKMLFLEVGDRITVLEPHTGIQHDYWIRRIAHQVGEGGLLHRATFGCEKAFDVDTTAVYVWDGATATYGTATFGA